MFCFLFFYLMETVVITQAVFFMSDYHTYLILLLLDLFSLGYYHTGNFYIIGVMQHVI